jgi:transcriptional regulator with XRE-family HTH domain
MGRKAVILLPTTERLLQGLGEHIQLARLRRTLSAELVAERAGISRASLWAVEKGSPSVAIGIYAQVLLAIGMEEDLLLVAKDDELGQKLQDAKLIRRKRAPKKNGNA